MLVPVKTLLNSAIAFQPSGDINKITVKLQANRPEAEIFENLGLRFVSAQLATME